MVTPTLTPAPVELDRWRRDTPGCRDRIHLNNAGAGLMPRPVLDALTNHLAREATIGGYEAADEAEPLVRETYALVAQLVGAAPRNIALVENATVAFSQALSAFDFRPGDRIVTTRSDYPSNQLMYLSLARRAGVETVRADDLPEGGVDAESVRRLARDPRTRLVALSWVPTNSGLVQDARAVGEVCAELGVPYVVDACQTVGQMAVDVNALRCDFLAATGASSCVGPAASASCTCPIAYSSGGRSRCFSTCAAPTGPTRTRSAWRTVRAASRTGSSPTPSSSASAPPPVMPSRPAGWGMSEPGGSPRCCASGSRRCRRGGCSTAAGSGAPSSRSTSAGRTPPSWSCVSASAASTPARPTACPACSIWTRNARPRCSASRRTTTIRKTSSMPRSRRSSTWYADDPTSHAVADGPRGGAARAGSQEPARDGHAGDRRNSGDDRLQPTWRPRPNAVRRAGAMGQSVVPRGGRGHDDRAHQGCPGRGAASRRRKYSIWAIPDSAEWTLIFSKAADVFHIPYPGPAQDALRVAVKPQAGPFMEALAFYFPAADADRALLNLHWGETVVQVPLATP